MPFDPSNPRKAFLMERAEVSSPLPEKAVLEAHDVDPIADVRDSLPPEALAEIGDVPRGLKLTMPDGSEWLMSEEALAECLDAVRESRAYLAEMVD